MRMYVVTLLTHVDACVAKTWISYRCVSCHPWCTHRTSIAVKKIFFSVFLWLWTTVIVINVCNHGEHYETPCIYRTVGTVLRRFSTTKRKSLEGWGDTTKNLVSLLWCPWLQQLSRHVGVDAVFLSDIAALLGVTMKETVCSKSSRWNKRKILACILLWACSLDSKALGACSFSSLSPTVRQPHWFICNYKEFLSIAWQWEIKRIQKIILYITSDIKYTRSLN
jgi:hypothetical protein